MLISLITFFQSSSKNKSEPSASSTSRSLSQDTLPAPQNPSKVFLKNSVIKGYHVFQIRPPKTNPPTLLTIDREYTNTHDASACLVWLPSLETFPEDIHDQFTDEKRQLMLSDVAGLPVGHVPKCLSELFCDFMDHGGKIFAEVTGDPIPSFPPWPSKDQEGGGIVLPCHYSFIDVDIDMCITKLNKCLDAVCVGKSMSVEKH